MAAFLCDECKTPLPGACVNTGGNLVACPACGTALLAQMFPAFAQGITRGRIGDLLASEEDAGCFQHPARKADAACDLCGRFLCALCDLDLGGRDVCPVCVESARNTPSGLLTGNQRVLHDKLALLLTLVSVATILFGINPGMVRFDGHPKYILLFFILVPAAGSLFLALRYWREPGSYPAPRHRARTILAAGLSASILVFMAVAFCVATFQDLHR